MNTKEMIEEMRDAKERSSKIQRSKERDKKRVPLRIDDRTIIYVERRNCNEAYAIEYAKRLKNIENNLKERRH